jgi:cold shock CspA family protein
MSVHAFHEKIIGFIQAKGDTFQAKIGICFDSEGDNDCFVRVTHTQKPTKDLEEARAQLNATKTGISEVDAVFMNAIPLDGTGMTWLSVIQAANV